jgi:flagellar biosynthesis/type III secretory pathway protein FliH
MNANKLADMLEGMVTGWFDDLTLKEAATMLRKQQAEIEALNQRIERMIENQSHHEGIAHAGGFEQGHEAGRKLGMQQERALWELAASTQEIEK